jgi:hypothetical protein
MPDYLKIFYRKKNERLLFLFFDIKSINQATIKKIKNSVEQMVKSVSVHARNNLT